MDITIFQTMLPHDDPQVALDFYRDSLGFEVRNDVEYQGMHWITVGPAGQPDTAIVLYPPAATPGLTEDERRMVTEMMAKKVAEMAEPDRVMAERLHEIITGAAPGLEPKTWYGMPAYAKDGKVVCFFQGAAKFQARYATLGFNDTAKLDDGTMWPTAYALKKLTSADEKEIAELVKRAVS